MPAIEGDERVGGPGARALTLAIGLGVLVIPGSGCKDDRAATPTAESPSPPDVVSPDLAVETAPAVAAETPPAKPVPAEGGRLRPAPPLTPTPWAPMGQVLIPNPEAWLAGLRAAPVFADVAKYLEPTTVRSVIATGIEPWGGVVMTMRFDAPVACIVEDVPLDDLETALLCTVGFGGDEAALREALGDALTPASGHLGTVDADGTTVWVDLADGRASFATHESLRERAAAHVQANVLDRAAAVGPVIEIVARAEPIDRAVAAADRAADPKSKPGEPDTLRRLGVESVAVALHVVDGVPVLDGTGHFEDPRPRAGRRSPLVPADLDALPDRPLAFLVAASLDGSDAGLGDLGGLLTELTGIDPPTLAARWREVGTVYAPEELGRSVSLSLHARAHGAAGVTMVQTLNPGARRRPPWAAGGPAPATEALLGTLAAFVELEFEPAAAMIEGRPVDRVQISLTPEGRRRAEGSDLAAVIGARDRLVLDRLELDGAVVHQLDVRPAVEDLRALASRLRAPERSPVVPARLRGRADGMDVVAAASLERVGALTGETLGLAGDADEVWMVSSATDDARVVRVSTTRSVVEAAMTAIASL